MASTFLKIGQNFGSYFYRKLYWNNANIYGFVRLSSINSPPKATLNSQNNLLKNENLFAILAEVNSENLTQTNTVKLLITLSKLCITDKIDIEDLKNHAKFNILCHAFGRETKTMSHYLLIQGLKSLLELKVDPFSKFIDSIENEILWKSRKMNLKSLNLCLGFHVNFQESEYQKQVVKELISLIQKRWIEIDSASDILIILKNSVHFKEEFLCKVEDKALELVGQMTAQEIHNIFCVLPQTRRRPKPLLHALAYHLNQLNEKIHLKHAVDLLYSLSILNFPDTVLMELLTNNLLSEINEKSKGSYIASILKSCAKMKWRHTGLIEACCEWLKNNSDNARTQDTIAILLAIARLNYTPDQEELFKNLSKLDKSISNETWLDVVWSLCVLGKVNSEQLAYVLNPSFYQSLIEFPDYRSYNNKIKILNINAVAKAEFPNSSAYSENIFTDTEKIIFEQGKLTNQPVLESLSNFLPRGKFMATNLQTTLGFMIDAEFIMDTAGKPLSLLDYGIKAGLDEEIKPLPKDCQRFAILVWDFKDITLNTVSPTGINALAVRLLQKLGYTVLEIYQNEFNSNSTAVKRVQHLQRKINEKIKTFKKC